MAYSVRIASETSEKPSPDGVRNVRNTFKYFGRADSRSEIRTDDPDEAIPSTLRGLDERRALLDAMDPLQAGGWKMAEGDDWKIGKLPAGDDALWDFISRADARFNCVGDPVRFQRAVKVGKG